MGGSTTGLKGRGIGVRVRLGMVDPVSGKGGFEVVCIRPGRANGVKFSVPVLRSAAELFRNASCFVDHTGFLGGSRSVRDLAGVITEVRYEDGRGIVGRLRLVSGATWIEGFLRQLVEDRAAGLPVPNVGLSADLFVSRKGEEVTSIRRVNSVDIVLDPAAGGSIERVLNGAVRGGTVHGGAEMAVERVGHGGAAEAGVGLAVPDEGSSGLVPEGTSGPEDSGAFALHGGDGALGLRRVQCAAVLQSVLDANKDLPAAMCGLLVRRFRGALFGADELEAEVAAIRQAWADVQESGVIQGLGQSCDDEGLRPGGGGGSVVRGMWDSLDRVQMAFDRLMGLEIPSQHSELPRLSGIRELYLLLTGDYDMHGALHPERLTLANVTTSTMTSVVKNALNKVLVRSYNLRPRWWKPIAYEEDFTTLNDVTWITLGGIADLDTVSEGNEYAEKAWSDNEETSSFVKKGNYVGITLEMIDRDDVAAVKALPRKLGLAAARTLAGSVSNLFTAQSGTGPDLSDGKALFHLDHGNLLTTGLSTAAWDTVIQAMFKQAEATSSKRLGIRPGYLLVPIELEKTALTIMNSAGEPGTGDDDANVRQGSARVIAVPDWTDANDWAAAADPLDLPGVCIGYRFGREPEMFVADQDAVGSMFTNDEMRIKVRFFYAVGIGDHRALHKNNVA